MLVKQEDVYLVIVIGLCTVAGVTMMWPDLSITYIHLGILCSGYQLGPLW